MSWAYAGPAEIFAVFAEGAVFGVIFRHLAVDIAARMSRRLRLQRRAIRAALKLDPLRIQNLDLAIEQAGGRSVIDRAALTARQCGRLQRFASNDDGSPRLSGRI